MNEINRALLVEWAVRQLGKAVMVGALATFVCVLLVSASGDPDLGWLVVVFPAMAVGLTLYVARVPAPGSDEVLAQVEQKLSQAERKRK